MKIRTMFANLISRYQAAKDPIRYCRKLGAKVGENCVLKPSMLGTEPWLVTIGNHVLLAEGVRLLTHDGAGWCMANDNPQLRMDMWGGYAWKQYLCRNECYDYGRCYHHR